MRRPSGESSGRGALVDALEGGGGVGRRCAEGALDAEGVFGVEAETDGFDALIEGEAEVGDFDGHDVPEIPIVAVILIRVGVVTADELASKRPYIVVGCFVLGMLLTPPDIISQALLAIPMWLLFEVGVIFGRMITPQDESSP